MRILSLLPSATEMVYALGLEDSLVGVTHECDWPPAARAKQVVSLSALPEDVAPDEIDRLVSQSIGDGEPIYRLDDAAVRELRPDLVLTQDLCAVCAVPSGQVNEAMEALGCQAEVLSMDPNTLDEVLECILRLGTATGTQKAAETLVQSLRQRLRAVAGAVVGLERPRTFALEWSDPPFNGGHWVPGMIELAGGQPVLGCPGADSVRVRWGEIADAQPDVVVFMPCGYDLEAATREAESVLNQPDLSGVERFFAVDASAFFSRPGPRLVDGVEILASLLHPDSVPDHDGQVARRLR